MMLARVFRKCLFLNWKHMIDERRRSLSDSCTPDRSCFSSVCVNGSLKYLHVTLSRQYFGHHLAIFWGSFDHILGIIWPYFWDHSAIFLGSFYNIFAIIWPYFWDHLGTFWGSFGHILAIIWGSFSHILGIIWPYFRDHLAIFWESFGHILAIFEAWSKFGNMAHFNFWPPESTINLYKPW